MRFSFDQPSHDDPQWFEVLRWAGAAACIVIADVAMTYARMKEATAGLVFLTLVVWFAARAGIRLALFAAALCTISFDYFFLIPLHTFRLQGAQQWIEMFSFLICSVVVGQLAERARRETMQAQQRRDDVERLYTLSQEMMLHEDAARLIRDLPQLVARSFALDAVVLYVRDQDQFYSTDSEVQPSVRASLQALTQGHGGTMSGPNELSCLALMLGLKPIGALAWKPERLSREVATAIGAQVAIALTRALAIEAYTRAEALREGERLRTALVDSLTHELRTPLTSIRAAATTLLASEGLDEAARRDLDSLIAEESARLDRLIGDAVEMAEIDAKVVQVRPVREQARALLDLACEESRAVLEQHRVSISVDGPDSPALFDMHLLGRVLRHLVENAARYSPRGSRIKLRTWRAGGRLEFSVEDNGPGIDAADLPMIFEKFYRGSRAAAAGKGTGMGLAIARAILEAHGGGIDVSSTPGAGAIFHFWVPLVEREQDTACDAGTQLQD
ncbi:MAG TPA: ATP-binding protein [Terracidiphilus sp.]|nr:ATP-binding protein [Terracidiphilus sp.]